MENLYDKSIGTLELKGVLSQLAEHAISEQAKANALSLYPMTDAEDIKSALKRTTDAKRLIGLRGSPPFAGIREVSGSLHRADIGGALNPRELLDIASLLRAARMARGYLGDDSRITTCLDTMFNALSSNKYLEEMITGAILSEEEIADSASAQLSDIRRKIRAANAKIREVLQRMITSQTTSRYLQEPIVTQRSGRYVVPVKNEHKNDVGGLVHDVSATGATLFIEPVAVVQLNNDLRELTAKEQKEIERILAEFSAEVSAYSDNIRRDFEVLVKLDLIFAMGKLSYAQNAEEPEINTHGEVILKNARHPLLNPKKTVPVSIRLGLDFDTLIITGPNTGGKTVALKTIGLLTLMTECGLHIPTDSGSRVAVFERVYADIGDEQSIEQSLSTFSSHMTNIVAILSETNDSSLILFDELGAGTDPVEGAALAVSIIEYTRALGAKVAATTHYTELKSFALLTDRVENASCEFDVETLQPTYKLLIGIPGKSNAFAISKRLGLFDHIIEKARSLVNSEDVRFEEILSQLDIKRRAMEEERNKAEALRREAEALNKRAHEYDTEVEKKRENALDKAKADASRIIKDARAAVESAFHDLDEIKKMEQKQENGKMLNEARAALKHGLNEAENSLAENSKVTRKTKPLPRPLKVGDTVELISLGTKGTVLKLPDSAGNLQVQAGILKANVKLDDVMLIEENGDKTISDFIFKKQAELRNVTVKPEIDIRGMMTDEAENALSIYLDSAFMSKLNTVTIIHGKGTGALRKFVHDYLRKHQHVKNFRLGVYGEGENGVTIVELR